MKKEIGSIFPLNDQQISSAEDKCASFAEGRIYYSLCREALHDIALSLADTNKCVLIPAYTCQTVITPFEEAGWKCQYYSIHTSLRVDVSHLLQLVDSYHPSLVVVHPYFGMDLTAEERLAFGTIHNNGAKVVLDLTQCIFSEEDISFADYVVGSYRKWFPIPDGGFLIKTEAAKNIIQPEQENVEFVERELAAMYLRSQYFGNGELRTKDISIRLSKAADFLAEKNIQPHRMSDVAYNLLQKENCKNNILCRINNFSFLYNNIVENNKIRKVCQDIHELTTAPLYFTIYVNDRQSLQRILAQNAIYAPVIWPVEDERVLINDEVKYIYNNILAIPCDQRYDYNDMQRVVDIINNY